MTNRISNFYDGIRYDVQTLWVLAKNPLGDDLTLIEAKLKPGQVQLVWLTEVNGKPSYTATVTTDEFNYAFISKGWRVCQSIVEAEYYMDAHDNKGNR